MVTDSCDGPELNPLGGLGCPEDQSRGEVVGRLAEYVEPAGGHVPCVEILSRFSRDDSIQVLPVVDASCVPLALVGRDDVTEFFQRPGNQDFHGHRPIADVLGDIGDHVRDFILVDMHCSLEDATRAVLARGVKHLTKGVLVGGQEGYRGLIHGRDLLHVLLSRMPGEDLPARGSATSRTQYGRASLANQMELALRRAGVARRMMALLFVDLDHFKLINDSLGYGSGNHVMGLVTERLRISARRSDTVVHLGSDEFVMLVNDIDDAAEVDSIGQRLVQSLRLPLDVFGNFLVVTASVGGAIFPLDDGSLDTLMTKADAAMREAKLGGRNCFRRYSTGTAMWNPHDVLFQNDLRRAIENDELVLFFQPQVRLATQEIRGVEVLVRWRHPTRGLILPGEFIPVAEQCGLIVQLGEWVLRHTFQQIRAWREAGEPMLRVSVNIAAPQFHQGDLAELLQQLSEEYEVSPRLLELEMTESMLMRDIDEALTSLKKIKALGVSLAIDDFGTGFSSLSYLQRFPIDRLKIDKSFVRDIEHLPANESIARAIVALASSLSLGVVAEGIEKVSETAVLEHLQCAEGQGFLFAEPLDVDGISAWLAQHRESVVIQDLFEGCHSPASFNPTRP